jgi:peroxin-5
MQMQQVQMIAPMGGSMDMLSSFEQEARQQQYQHQPPPHAAMEAAFQDAQQHRSMGRDRRPMHHHLHARPTPPRPPAGGEVADAWVNSFQNMHLLDGAWDHSAKSHEQIAWEEAHHQRHFQRPLQPQQQQLRHSSHQYTSQHSVTTNSTTATAEVAQTDRQSETMRVSREMAEAMRQNPDPKWQNSEFLQFMNKVSSGEVELDEVTNEAKVSSTNSILKMEGALEGVWSNDENTMSGFDEGKTNRDIYETSWQSSTGSGGFEQAFQESAGPFHHHTKLEEAWDNVGSATATATNTNYTEEMFDDIWNNPEENLEAIWEKAMAEAQDADPFEEIWGSNGQVDRTSDDYEYQAENPYLNGSDTFKKGMEFFEAGHLSEAILAFEAEVQQHPENSEAWRLLGECHAENDEDKSAIVCLERSIEEDPYNLQALLALGVSHVNELNPQGALRTLKAWVQHNPKFHGFEIKVDEYSDGSLMDEVMQLMLQARSHDPQDIDVQVVLGVLYNVSKDYDAAVASFQQVTNMRPNEYSLWNKLGATLANSSHSQEAIPSYHKALELKPRYARGWLNLGISHANLGNYEESIKCYLQALSLNARAEHIWSYLRIACTCIERFDLVKLADTRDINLFREEFKLIDF